MRLALIYFFLTFVVGASAWAAPDSDLKAPKINTRPNTDQSEWGAKLIPTRSNADHTLTFSLGTIAGSLSEEGENTNATFLGISQTKDLGLLTAHEFGVEILDNGQMGAHLARKKLMRLGENFEPYYKVGVGALYKSTEGFGSLVNYKRYQGRASIGLDDIMGWKRRLRGEVGIAYGFLGLTYQAWLGYSLSD